MRIGFIGVGGMGQMAHLRNYVTTPGCSVVAICEIRRKTGEEVARRYGIPRLYENYVSMLESEELDGVVVCQPFDRHAVLLPDIYPRVKCVFTEKPLAVSVRAAEDLAAAAEASGCTHMVGYHKRSDPAAIRAKGTVDSWRLSGEVGPLQYVRILMPAGDWIASGFDGLVDAGDPRGSLDREPAGALGFSGPLADEYRAFVNYYIHQVNLMRWLLGEPYGVTYADPSGVLLAVRSNSGVAGVIEMSPYRTTVAWEEEALVAFEKGYVKLRLPAPLAVNRCGSVEVYRDPGEGQAPERCLPTLPWVHAMRQQACAFVELCRGQAEPPCGAREAVEDLRVARDYVRMRSGQ